MGPWRATGTSFVTISMRNVEFALVTCKLMGTIIQHFTFLFCANLNICCYLGAGNSLRRAREVFKKVPGGRGFDLTEYGPVARHGYPIHGQNYGIWARSCISVSEKDTSLSERDISLSERDITQSERDKSLSERDLSERDISV